MITALLAKFWGYLAAAGAIVAAIGIAVFYGREKGKESMQSKVDDAHASAGAATAVIHTMESRDETEQATAKLSQPVAPQVVDTADPDSAAGKLRDEGFTRD